jgi:diaminohydroxyphosphoribosylaminopyrimidine deaminase/5-amino-6-(5-phosphoribosylamino)uracil reductase
MREGTMPPGTAALPLRSAALHDDILAPIRGADPRRPFVVAQLGQSLDGRIATPTGESRWINRDAALDHVHRLRAAVDAVVVGIGTVVADDPILNVRRVPGRHPARVVIDPCCRLRREARCMAGEDGVARYVVRACEHPVPEGVERIHLERGPDRAISPVRIIEALHARGLGRILIEGGAWTVSQFIDAGVVDRLHVLVAPVILGSGKTGLSLAPIVNLASALRPVTRVHVLEDGDVLFDCDLRSNWACEVAVPPRAFGAVRSAEPRADAESDLVGG